MKKIILSILIAGASFLAQAQTNTPQSFLVSVQSYLTSFNTNYSFTNISIELSTGYKQVTGVNAASFIDGQYDFNNGFNVDASLQFSGIGSPINAGELGLGWNVIRHYDAEVNVSLLGGYDDVQVSGVIEPGITIKKKMSENTYLELGASLPVYFKHELNTNPTFRVGTGFTF